MRKEGWILFAGITVSMFALAFHVGLFSNPEPETEITTCPEGYILYHYETKDDECVKEKIKIAFYAWEYYGIELKKSNAIQGLIGEIDDNKITFASGNSYTIAKNNTILFSLKAGDIVTINEDFWQRTPCELRYVELTNGTKFVNLRELEWDSGKLTEERTYLDDEEMSILYRSFRTTDVMDRREMLDLIPYSRSATCNTYTNFSFVGLDDRLGDFKID